MLNVKDYGVIGDGTTDDYAALQAVADLVVSLRYRVTPTGGSLESHYPAVLFPEGQYRVSQAVDWGSQSHLYAEGSAIILPDAAAFKFYKGYQIRVENLTFIGGTTAIDFTNNNANGARISLHNCRFQGQTDYSIKAYPFTAPWFSSQVVTKECKWYNCYGAIQSQADVNTVSDGWFQWSEANAAPYCFAITGGRLSMTDSMGVPQFTADNGHRWIGHTAVAGRNGGAGVFCDRTLFHGENGGLPPIEIVGSPDVAYPFQGATISLNGCQCSPGATAWAGCGLINLNNGLPQMVSVNGCSGVIGPAPLIRDTPGTSQTIFNTLSNGTGRMRLLLGANGFYPLSPPVPAWMLSYVRAVAG